VLITLADGKEQSWYFDLKKSGVVGVGKAPEKADISIALNDDVFVDLASGKLNGQKAFMQGKIKVKGQMMLATRLDAVLKTAQKNAPSPSKASTASSAAPSTASSGPSSKGNVEVPDFESSPLFSQIKSGIETAPQPQREANVKKVRISINFIYL